MQLTVSDSDYYSAPWR